MYESNHACFAHSLTPSGLLVRVVGPTLLRCEEQRMDILTPETALYHTG